jgi:hypothetical protein
LSLLLRLLPSDIASRAAEAASDADDDDEDEEDEAAAAAENFFAGCDPQGGNRRAVGSARAGPLGARAAAGRAATAAAPASVERPKAKVL